MAKQFSILWEFHQAYTPTAAGSIERFNGLLKAQLLKKEQPLWKALHLAVIELNQRPRLNRQSPIQEAIHKNIRIEYPEVQDNKLIRPHHAIYRNPKNQGISPAEIITEGHANNAWISQGKADLKLVRLEDLA